MIALQKNNLSLLLNGAVKWETGYTYIAGYTYIVIQYWSEDVSVSVWASDD